MLTFKKNELLYYVGLIILSILNWEYFSNLINFGSGIKALLMFIVIILFSLKVLLERHNSKELFSILTVLLITFIVSYRSNMYYIFLNAFSIIASKNIELKDIIKFLLYINLFFLCAHIFTYLIGINANSRIYYSTNGKILRYSMNLRHPNTLSAIILWITCSIVYLKQNSNKYYLLVVIGLAMLLSYYLTYSRTSMIIYFMLLIIVFFKSLMKKNEIINKIVKTVVIISIVLEIILAFNYNNENLIMRKINNTLSYRLILNNLAVNTYQTTLLGVNMSNNYKNVITIDSFYISCLVEYGVAFLILFIISMLKYKSKNSFFSVILLSFVFIIGLSERYIIFATLAFPLFFLKKNIFEEEAI